MSAVGGSPVVLTMADIYLSVQKGIVDGSLFSLAAFRSFRMDEVCKYHTICGFNGGVFYIVMSQKKWDSLPADVQKAMEGVTGDWMSQFCAKAEDNRAAKVLDYLKTAPGHEVIYLSAAERERWVKAVAPVWDKWVLDNEAKGLPARKVLDAALKFAKEWKE
jgi:TRAP-type C4-dicarboxylate transport system substrate-binding protein